VPSLLLRQLELNFSKVMDSSLHATGMLVLHLLDKPAARLHPDVVARYVQQITQLIEAIDALQAKNVQPRP